MIAIIDYEMGNLRSVQKAFERLGKKAVVTSRADDLNMADKIVLPGVGAFQDAMHELDKKGLIEPIVANIKAGKPFLGICLGLQLLFSKGFEDGEHKGLDIIPGCVTRFFDGKDNRLSEGQTPDGKTRLKIPHMGWNRIDFTLQDVPILKDISSGAYMYFVHSYYACPEDRNIIAAETDYGIAFPSLIWKDNVFATQFHPEKSQTNGLHLLKNFAGLRC